MARFQNRLVDVDRLMSRLGEGSKLILVAGKPGVGKTRLIREVATKSRAFTYVAVDRRPSDRAPAYSIDLLELLSQEIDRISVEQELPALDETLPSMVDIFTNPDRLFPIAAKASKIAAAVIEGRSQYLTARGISAYSAGLRAVHVQEALKKRPCLVHIDHAAACSVYELDAVARLIETSLAVFILEIDDDPNLPISIPNTLTARLDVLPIEGLHAQALFRSLPDAVAAQARSEFEASGDLRPFGRLEALSRFPIDVVQASTGDGMWRMANVAIGTLPPKDLNGLVAICAHYGPIDLPLLDAFLRDFASSAGLEMETDAGALLHRLDQAVLVVSTGYDFEVNSSAREIIESDRKRSTVQLAFRKCWRELYRSARDIPLFMSDDRRCAQLLRQCAALGDIVGIERTLAEIGIANRDAYNLISVVGYIAEIVDKVSFPPSRHGVQARTIINSALVRFLYEAGWFLEAAERLSHIASPSRKQQYLYIELLCSTGKARGGIRLATAALEALRNTSDPDINEVLCLELILIHGLRTDNRLVDARRHYKQALTNPRYWQLNAYAVLLRFADLCLTEDGEVELCTGYLVQATEYARSLNFEAEEVCSLNALVQQFGYLDLDRAADHLKSLEAVADRVWFQRAMLLNNRAVLSIYAGTAAPLSLRSLEQALMLCVERLDAILVRCNILSYRMIYDPDRSIVDDLISMLGDLVAADDIDTEITRITLYNLEQACRELGRDAEADAFRSRWIKLESGIDQTYWHCRRTGTTSQTIPEWRLKQKYYPVYLSHWHIGSIPFDAIRDDERN